MQEIVLSGAEWTTPDDLYTALLSSLGAPDWHGHNLDAVWDSIAGGDINQVNPPFMVRIVGVDVMPPKCKALVNRLVALAAEARVKGLSVEVVCQ